MAAPFLRSLFPPRDFRLLYPCISSKRRNTIDWTEKTRNLCGEHARKMHVRNDVVSGRAVIDSRLTFFYFERSFFLYVLCHFQKVDISLWNLFSPCVQYVRSEWPAAPEKKKRRRRSLSQTFIPVSHWERGRRRTHAHTGTNKADTNVAERREKEKNGLRKARLKMRDKFSPSSSSRWATEKYDSLSLRKERMKKQMPRDFHFIVPDRLWAPAEENEYTGSSLGKQGIKQVKRMMLPDFILLLFAYLNCKLWARPGPAPRQPGGGGEIESYERRK